MDVAFANAGISLEAGVLDERGGLEDLDRAQWDAVLGVNLNGVLFTMQEAARHMKKQGSGRIVVTASTAGVGTDPMVGYSYSATKAAVIIMVRQAALELAQHGVHVNAIAPGRSAQHRRRRGADPARGLERHRRDRPAWPSPRS